MQLSASAFDSQFYDLRIGRLACEPGDTGIAAELARARGHYDVVFVRLADGDPLCDELDRAGHRPVDILVTSTLVAAPPAIPHPDVSSWAIEQHATLTAPADLAAIETITGTIQTSHLHADPRLPLDRTTALYAAWARNDVTGRAARTFVTRSAPRSDGAITGYLAALATPVTSAVATCRAAIDLIAVAPETHGRGLGSALIAAFIAWARERGGTATVGTQHDNPALRLYARCGFAPSARHLTYHVWL